MKIITEMMSGNPSNFVGLYYIGAWLAAIRALILITDRFIPKWKSPPEDFIWTAVFGYAVASTVMANYTSLCEDVLLALVYGSTLIAMIKNQILTLKENREILPEWRIVAEVGDIGLSIAGSFVVLIAYLPMIELKGLI